MIIFKLEIFEEGLLIPIIEYEIYNFEKNIKLDLNICNNTNINIFIPINIEEKDLFKYDPNSDYYNDKCFPYKSIYKTDIIINDRRNEFIKNNMSLCEINCQYNGYNISNKKVNCKCKPKLVMKSLSEIISDKDKLFNSFIDIKNISNIMVIKCYYTLFTKKGLLFNIGS